MTNEQVIADLLARAKPLVYEVPVCTAGDLVARHAALMAQLDALSKEHGRSIAGNTDATAILAEIDQVEAEQEAETLTVTVSSVGRKAWADLLRAHPPRPEDKGSDHNTETFPVAAVAAATGSTVAQIEALAEALPGGEWKKLWDHTIAANVMGMPHPKVPAGITALVHRNGASSTTPPNVGSPAQPS